MMMSKLPLVSCIMPTANREIFIPNAINYFKRQNYPDKELIIVDDGIKSIQHLLPDDPSIKYIRLDKIQPIGTKRNWACEASKGDIIVHWDDDDWYAQDWISAQISTLCKTEVDVCGLSSFYFYDPRLQAGWKYTYPPYDRPWVTGATLAYHKSHWITHPFKELKVGEDNRFIWDSDAKVAFNECIDGFVAMIHGQNTVPKTTGNPRWKPITKGIIENILNEDVHHYASTLFLGK